MASEPFSVLLPVYAGDDAGYVERAFESVTIDQHRPPDEVVVVQDGPVPAPLQALIRELVGRADVPVTVVELPEHRGLGRALGEGMRRCRYDIVARMDADDVARPERFARQVPLIESGFDLVGSSLVEMRGDDETELGDIRRPPLTHARIIRFARFHSPFNHPTVVLRRSAADRAGGYEQLRSFEDYWLWVRMLAGGARAANVEEPLLLYRVPAGVYERRGGVHLVRPEIELQLRMRRLGFISRIQFLRNVLVRVTWRLCPLFLRRWLYGFAFRSPPEPLPVGNGP